MQIEAVPRARPLLESALMAALGAVLGLLGALPLLALFLGFFAAVPAAVVQYRWGGFWGVWSALGSNLILFLVLGPAFLSTGIFLITVGPALGEAFRRGAPVWVGIGVGFLGSVVGGFLLILLGALLTGAGTWGHVLGQFNAFLDQGFRSLTASLTPVLEKGGMSAAQAKAAEANLRAVLAKLRGELLPSLLLGTALLYGIAFYLATRIILRRTGAAVGELAPFAEWRLPEWVLPLYLVGLAAYLGGNLAAAAGLRIFGENVSLLLFYPLLIQGMAAAYYFFRRWNLGRAGAAVLVGLGVLLGLGELFFWLGILEAVADFRHLRGKTGALKG